MTSLLVHPLMMQALTTIFNSTCTIEAETVTQDGNSGEETLSYSAVDTMTDVLCYVEPQSQMELRRADQTIVDRPWVICLQGYYPLIDVEDRAIIDSTQVHNILAVRHDDTHTVTFLDTEIINVPVSDVVISDNAGYATGFDWPFTYAS